MCVSEWSTSSSSTVEWTSDNSGRSSRRCRSRNALKSTSGSSIGCPVRDCVASLTVCGLIYCSYHQDRVQDQVLHSGPRSSRGCKAPRAPRLLRHHPAQIARLQATMVPETRLGVHLDRDDHDRVGVHVYCIFHSTDD